MKMLRNLAGYMLLSMLLVGNAAVVAGNSRRKKNDTTCQKSSAKRYGKWGGRKRNGNGKHSKSSKANTATQQVAK